MWGVFSLSLEMASKILLAAELRFKIEAAKERQMSGCISRSCTNVQVLEWLQVMSPVRRKVRAAWVWAHGRKTVRLSSS